MNLSKKDCLKISTFAKTFSNPVRVKLMCALQDGMKNVTTLCEELDSRESNISQQLRYLYNVGYIKKKRQGREIFYGLKGKKILDLLKKLKDISK